jgi:cellobiose-specific phosphotransferase system component IIB
MKKLIITCAFGISGSIAIAQTTQNAQTQLQDTRTVTTQQQGPSAEASAERRAKMYQKQLSLTPEQYKGVYKAELDLAKKEQGMRASGRQAGPGESMQMQMTHDQQLKAAMNADQYAKYELTKPKPVNSGAPTPVTR